MENANTSAYLQSILETVERQLDLLTGAPSVQMHDVPDSFLKNRSVCLNFQICSFLLRPTSHSLSAFIASFWSVTVILVWRTILSLLCFLWVYGDLFWYIKLKAENKITLLLTKYNMAPLFISSQNWLRTLISRGKPETDPDKRPSLMDDLKTEANGEFYDGDSDQDGEEEGDSWASEATNLTVSRRI